jgi:O-antigen ligase/tetratricopeptide (TPR) repeat protein
MLQRLALPWLFVHLMLSPLVFSAATVEVFEYNKVALLTVAAIFLLAGSLAVLAGRALRGEPLHGDASAETWGAWARRLAREPIALGMVVFFVSSLLSMATAMNVLTAVYGAHESFAGIFTMAGYLVLFFATREVCRTTQHWRLVFFASVVGLAGAGIYGVIQLTGLDPIRWGRTSGYGGITRVFATMGHPNFYSAFLLAAFPFAAYFAIRSFRFRLPLVGLAIAATAALGEAMVVISISRGAWAGFAVALVVLLAGWWLFAKDRVAVAWIVGLNIAAFAATVLVLMTFPDGRAVLESMVSRFRNMLDTAAVTSESRSFIWAASWQMFKDHPWFGVGLDNFQLAFEQYRTVDYWMSEWNGTPTKAHNEALHILAMHGVPGGVAMLLIVGGLGVAFRRALRRGDLDRGLLVAVFASAVGFVVQDLVSFTVAGCGTLFVTCAAFLSRAGEPPAPPAPESAPFPRAVAPEVAATALAVQVALFGGACWMTKVLVVDPYAANSACRSGAAHLTGGGDAAAAAAELRLAKSIDPTKELYWVRLGTACQMHARGLQDRAARRKAYDEARQAYERSIELVPINSYNHANLGRLLVDLWKETGDPRHRDASIKAFEAALEIDPNNAYFYADGANAALAFGDVERARRWAATCVEKYPHFGQARSQLGYIALREADTLAVQGKGEEAKARFKESAELLGKAVDGEWYGDDTSRAIAASNLSAALIRAEDYRGALKAGERSTQLLPDYVDARYNLGRARDLTSDLPGAHAEFVRALQIHPGHPMSKAALKELRQRMTKAGTPLPALPPAVQRMIEDAPPPAAPAPGPAPAPAPTRDIEEWIRQQKARSALE